MSIRFCFICTLYCCYFKLRQHSEGISRYLRLCFFSYIIITYRSKPRRRFRNETNGWIQKQSATYSLLLLCNLVPKNCTSAKWEFGRVALLYTQADEKTFAAMTLALISTFHWSCVLLINTKRREGIKRIPYTLRIRNMGIIDRHEPNVDRWCFAIKINCFNLIVDSFHGHSLAVKSVVY